MPQSAKESPPWLPVLMLGLFVLGGVAIMARYLVFPDSNWPMLVGLVCLLGGLFRPPSGGSCPQLTCSGPPHVALNHIAVVCPPVCPQPVDNSALTP